MVEREVFIIIIIIDTRESTVRDVWKSRSGRENRSLNMVRRLNQEEREG